MKPITAQFTAMTAPDAIFRLSDAFLADYYYLRNDDTLRDEYRTVTDRLLEADGDRDVISAFTRLLYFLEVEGHARGLAFPTPAR